MMSQRPRRIEPLNEHLEGHILMLESLQTAGPDLRQHLGHGGIPTQIHPQHQRVDENPTRSSKTGSERPAIGKPTATSEVPPSLPNNTANAACTTMKAVALCCRASQVINSCTSTGHSTATAAPR